MGTRSHSRLAAAIAAALLVLPASGVVPAAPAAASIRDGGGVDPSEDDGPVEDPSPGTRVEDDDTAPPSPLPSPREPGPEVTIPADPGTPDPTGPDRCARGQYGDVLPDGTVDARCDGVLGFAEQRFPTTLRREVDALVGEAASLSLEERDVPGRVLRVDAVSARGGTVTRFPLLYVSPQELDGRDSFSLWTLEEDGYQREVRVVVDVRRPTGALDAGPPRGVLVRESEAAVASGGRVSAFERSTVGWLLPAAWLVVLLGLLSLGWGAARRRGLRVELPAPAGDHDGPSPTTFTAGSDDPGA